MGIQGLLRFVKDATEDVHVKEYANQTVAIDTYCWLHKGSFACAEKLAKKEKTDQYVKYCMKYLDMLELHKVRPILVFDGCNLPSKELVEHQRHKRRKENLEKGKQFLREGKLNAARDCFTKCISVTPAMALEVIQAARKRGIDCIVAPYEADAQLAFLSKKGIVQAVITEDSDLLCFGCTTVIFKMDMLGRGQQVKMENLGRVKNLIGFTPDLFRHMCILSGCDYLPSVKGVGLVKACKALKLSKSKDAYQVARKLHQYIKSIGPVEASYGANFERADKTFLYQLVFDPSKRELVPLNEYASGVNPDELTFAGTKVSDHQALQIAVGNVDVNTKLTVSYFDIDAWVQNQKSNKNSIWSCKNKPIKYTDNSKTVFAEKLPKQIPKNSPRSQKEEPPTLNAENVLDGVLNNDAADVDQLTNNVEKIKKEISVSVDTDLINSYMPSKRRKSPRKSGRQIVKSRFFSSPAAAVQKEFIEIAESESLTTEIKPKDGKDNLLQDILSEISAEVKKSPRIQLSPEEKKKIPFSNTNSASKRTRLSLNSSGEGLEAFTRQRRKKKKLIIPTLPTSSNKLEQNNWNSDLSDMNVEKLNDFTTDPECIPVLDLKEENEPVTIKHSTTDFEHVSKLRENFKESLPVKVNSDTEMGEEIPVLDNLRQPLTVLDDGNGHDQNPTIICNDRSPICLSSEDEELILPKKVKRKTLGLRRSTAEPQNQTVSKYFGGSSSQKLAAVHKKNLSSKLSKSKSQSSIKSFFAKS